MNDYLKAVKEAINLHGRPLTYVSVGESTYDFDTATVTSTTTTYQAKGYRKHIKTNQYNYPDLVGQDVVMFYMMPTELTVKPKPQDTITDSTGTYKVISYQEHEALGQTILMRIICVKG